MGHKTIIVGNQKGGVGKDKTAEFIYTGAVAKGPVRLIEFEAESRLNPDYFADMISIQTGHSPEEIRQDPNLASDSFASLLEALKRKDCLNLVVLGASLMTPLFSFLAMGKGRTGRRVFAEGEDLIFVFPTTMQDQSLSALSAHLIETQAFPKAGRFVVLNDVVADFIEGDPYVRELIAEGQGGGKPVEIIRMKRCNAPAWGHMMNIAPIHELMTGSDELLDILIDKRKVRDADADMSLSLFEKWCHPTLEAFAPLIEAATAAEPAPAKAAKKPVASAEKPAEAEEA